METYENYQPGRVGKEDEEELKITSAMGLPGLIYGNSNTFLWFILYWGGLAKRTTSVGSFCFQVWCPWRSSRTVPTLKSRAGTVWRVTVLPGLGRPALEGAPSPCLHILSITRRRSRGSFFGGCSCGVRRHLLGEKREER